MRPFTPKLYHRLITESHDPVLIRQMQQELDMISSIPDVKDKTLIDLGAGYGRVTKYLSQIARKVISIEINPLMFSELECTSNKFNNCKVINGDFLKLRQLLSFDDIHKPVFLVLQNTIGTIEGENFSDFLLELKACCQIYKGEVILTFFKQETLHEWGVGFYNSIGEMTGPIDIDKTIFEKGLFFSKTGYFSKWRSEQDIQNIIEILDCAVVNKVATREYCIIYLVCQ